MINFRKNEQRSSIRHNIVFFSVILFVLIFIGGSTVFVLAMLQNVRINIGHELQQSLELERIKLEASVNGEIAIALKMADSPIIQAYFANPTDPVLEQSALTEIAGYKRAFAGNTVFWVNDIDHKFYSDDAYAFTIDITDPNNYWYLMTLNETEKYNFNINYNPDLDVTNLWINAPVFDSNRKPIGILGTGIDLTAFVDSIYRDYEGKAAMYFYNADGEITGALDSSLVANKVTLAQRLGDTGLEILTRSATLKAGEPKYFEASEGVVAIDKVAALDWYVAAIQSIGVADILGSSMTFLFLAMMTAIAIVFVIFNVFIVKMLFPMNYMVKTLDNISVDWDLTQRLQLRRKDEIGTLGNFINLTFEKIRELLEGIKGKTVALSDIGEELTSFMLKTRSDVDGINNNIQEMREQVLSQSDKVNATASSIEFIIKEIDELDGHISVQADSVSQSSSAIEEMIANIHSVTRTLVNNTENIDLLTESSEAGRVDLQKVSADIQEIAQESESLMQINRVMQNIASQTNLLSMNAAIEAAHAGETGKGFAVVADEIRKLAEDSSIQSKTISAALKKIKTMIDDITKSTSAVLERFETIETKVKTVSNQETEIRNAMEEQGAGSQQILETITRLNSITNLVRKTSSDMTTESKQVMGQSVELKRITSDVSCSMDDMTHGVDEISKTITRVQEITEENKENIEALSADTLRFKV